MNDLLKISVLVLGTIAFVWASIAFDSLLCTIGAFFCLLQLLDDL